MRSKESKYDYLNTLEDPYGWLEDEGCDTSDIDDDQISKMDEDFPDYCQESCQDSRRTMRNDLIKVKRDTDITSAQEDKLYVKARANLDYVSSVLTTLKDVPAQYRDSGGTNAAALEADTIKKIDYAYKKGLVTADQNIEMVKAVKDSFSGPPSQTASYTNICDNSNIIK